MANGLTTDWSKLSKELEEKAKKKDKREPKISLGRGPDFTSTGTRTASQDIAQGYKRIDPRELTPFQKEMMGGEEKIAKEKEAAENLIASETPSKKPLSITGEKKVEAKTAPKSATKAKDEKPQPDIYRVMMQGGDASKDTFYDTKDAADAALKKMGGKGAVVGVRFPAETSEKKSQLKEQYMQRAAMGGKVATTPKADETEEEAIKRRVREVNPQATPAQQQNYYNTLTASRARGRERGGYAEEYQAAAAQGKTPSPYEERRMQEEARNRKMSDFITRSAARDAAREKEKSFQSEFNYLKNIERSARRSGQFGVALDAKRQIDDLSGSLGSNARNVTARRKLFETEAMESAKRNIEARDRLRREKLIKSTTSNPEASSPSKTYI